MNNITTNKDIKSVSANEQSRSLPKGWEIKKLGEVCEVYNGLWKGKKEPFLEVGVIRNTNFTKDGFLDDSNIAYLPVEVKQYEKRKLQFGDIILEKSGGGPKQPVGRVVPFEKKEGEFSFSNFTSVIRIKDDKLLNYTFLHRFLFWTYMSGVTEKMQRRSTGIRNLQLKEYKQIPIPIPPLPEQKRIVSILDKVFSAIEQSRNNAEQNLKNAKELFDSYLNRIFSPENPEALEGWEEKTLGEVCEINMGQSPKGTSYNTEGIGTPLINGPVEFGKEPFSKTKRIKFTTEPTKYCKKGDLILCVRGSTTGRINIAGFDACIGRGVASIRYSENQLWVNYYILASRQKIYNLGTGATFPNVSSQILKKMMLPIPQIQEQKQIVAQLDKLQAETKKLEAIYQKKIDDLEELKKSILQKAFNGEL